MNSSQLASSLSRARACGRSRALLAALLLVFTSTAQTGGKGSLSKEFEKMSPKERARVAREEQAASANDPAYLNAMAQGEMEFKNGDYDAAMASYEEARRLRPLNVYPKVKIEDLLVLIRKRDAELAAAKDTAPAITQEPAEVMDRPMATIKQQAPSTQTTTTAQRTGVSEKPSPQVVKVVPVEKHGPVPAQIPAEVLPDGTKEKRYKEGNAEVTEITITEHGRTTVFKRVAHKWGQIYWFEDGQAIDGRVWVERFGDKP